MSLPCLLCSKHVPRDQGFHWPGVNVCAGCVTRLGTFLTTQPTSKLGLVWAVEDARPERGGRADVVEELMRATEGPDRQDAEEVLEDLRRITREGSSDAVAAADLAMAFAEMGLHRDALEQAATVLLMAQDNDATLSALKTTLGHLLLKPDGRTTLRNLLFPQ